MQVWNVQFPSQDKRWEMLLVIIFNFTDNYEHAKLQTIMDQGQNLWFCSLLIYNKWTKGMNWKKAFKDFLIFIS